MSERRHDPVFPGFADMAERRQSLAAALAAHRLALGLSQTEVAARMGTSQSAVARLESGDADLRLSTLQRYAAALGQQLDWRLETDGRVAPPEPREEQ
jgi:transcriptional regulator with XRE-family HTH domain